MTKNPKLHPRDPEEWQGMLVDLNMMSLCDDSHGCGLAMACYDGKCGPCKEDRDCRRGEACVLDHCVLSENVDCRRRKDCEADFLCVLTGYSSDSRGNGKMSSVCLKDKGGKWQQEDLSIEAGERPGIPPPFESSQLLDELREYIKNK